MKIGVAIDNTIPLHFPLFGQFIQAHAKALSCHQIKSDLRFSQVEIDFHTAVANLNDKIKQEIKEYDLVFLVTSIPFENNYFFVGVDGLAIISFSNWHMLTSLPISNGLAYIMCQFIIKYVMKIGASHDNNTGCINDFLWNKSGIDVCMRAAFICDACKQKDHSNKYLLSREFSDIISILNAISTASRDGRDILNELSAASTSVQSRNSVFLCHNSDDKPAVRRLNEALCNAGISTWLDEQKIKPGDVWQTKLESAISEISACLVIVGDSGAGPWQEIERRTFISEFANRQCKIIPVLIGNPARAPELPLFLKQFMWVDLRGDDGVNLASLIAALSG